MSTNDNSIRRTVLPPLGDDGVRRWGGGATPDTASASDLDALVVTIADSMSDFIDRLPGMVERMVENRMQASQNEMRALIAEALGTLRGELRGVLTGLRSGQLDPKARTRKADGFKFAGEHAEDNDEPIDLPSWRTGKTIIN